MECHAVYDYCETKGEDRKRREKKEEQWNEEDAAAAERSWMGEKFRPRSWITAWLRSVFENRGVSRLAGEAAV